MPLKNVVYALAGVWFVLVVASFVSMQFVEPSGSGFTRGLNRIASFLTWQTVAFVAATALALFTRRASLRGHEGLKLVGYAPLAVSIFIVVSVIAIIGYRVFVAPMMPAA